MHDASLVDRLSDELAGTIFKSDFRALCLTLLRGQRAQDHAAAVDEAEAEAAAERLHPDPDPDPNPNSNPNLNPEPKPPPAPP